MQWWLIRSFAESDTVFQPSDYTGHFFPYIEYYSNSTDRRYVEEWYEDYTEWMGGHIWIYGDRERKLITWI